MLLLLAPVERDLHPHGYSVVEVLTSPPVPEYCYSFRMNESHTTQVERICEIWGIVWSRRKPLTWNVRPLELTVGISLENSLRIVVNVLYFNPEISKLINCNVFRFLGYFCIIRR
jgi:hypothetical protein